MVLIQCLKKRQINSTTQVPLAAAKWFPQLLATSQQPAGNLLACIFSRYKRKHVPQQKHCFICNRLYIWLKMEIMVLVKNCSFFANKNRQINILSVNTSWLECQCTELFSLVVWPEEPPEIHFLLNTLLDFQKIVFHESPNLVSERARNWDDGLILGRNEAQ